MSLRKFCSPTLPDAHPMHCPDSPQCDHHWFYDFRVNRRRYRNTAETANKQQAKQFEAKERTRVLEGRQQIRLLPDISFAQFSATYLRDYAELHKKSVERDREILKVLNHAFGSLILHEITAHRIEQYKRDRLAGKWRGHRYKSAAKSIKPGTVNREMDTLRSLFSQALEWGQIREDPMRKVKRLKLDNRRTRILSEAEQTALLAACPKKLGKIVRLALITGARIGEILALTWDDVLTTELLLLETKNGRSRRLPRARRSMRCSSPASGAAHRGSLRTPGRTPRTRSMAAHVFKRAVLRADITTGDVSLHTLRHTALSRMIAAGIDDHTVMAISGHSSTRMLERYTHPTIARKVDALETFSPMGRNGAEQRERDEKSVGGRQEARTPDLRVANGSRRRK